MKMKKTTLIVFLLAAFAPMAQVWAYNSNYYAKLVTKVSSNSTGMGAVYAGTSETDKSSTEAEQSNYAQSGGVDKTFFAIAEPANGYEFLGWSTSDNGTTYESTAQTYQLTVKTSTSADGYNTKTLYANFKKKVLPSFNITFETSSAGSYTVDGAAPANKTGLTEATSVVLKSTDANFLNWLVNGTVVNDNPYTATCLANTSISAEFLTADQVTSVTTLSDLTSALSNAQYRKVMVSSGTEITVPSGTTVTVPAGKQLVVDGTILVFGSVTIASGAQVAGNGSLAKHWKTISQAADVHIPFPLGTDGVAGTGNGVNTVDGTAGKYLVTSVKDGSATVSGSFTCKEEFFVAVENKASGETYYSKPSTSKPVGVLCTVAREKALNWIEGVSETVYTDCATLLTASATPSASGTHEVKDTNKLSVLLANAGTVSYSDTANSSSALGFAVDLAGCSLTLTSKSAKSQWNSLKLVRFFNGSVSISQKVMNTNFCVYNMSGTFSYLSGSSYYTAISFYDSPNVKVSWNDMSSTTPAGGQNYYGGGTYNTTNAKFQTTPSTKFNTVYWGTFASGMNPTTYLYDTNKVGAEQDPKQSNAWVVYGIMPDPNAGEVKVNGEDTTLVKALANPQAGDVIVLQRDIAIESDVLVSTAASNVRIDLNGWKLTGANAIINNGDLEIIDVNGNGQIDVPVINNGTLLLSSAKYNGLITLNNGFCYFLAGKFNGGVAVASSVADATGVAEVCGGTYATLTYAHGGQNENLVDLCENGYVKDNAIAPIPVSYVTNPSFGSYSLSAFDGTTRALYTRNAARSGYTRDEWITLCKIKAASELFSGFGVDCAVTLDRDISANDLSVTAMGLYTFNVDVAISANNWYSALFQAMRNSGQATAPWTYNKILPGGEHDGSISFSLSNKAAQNGTFCLVEMRLATGIRNMSGPKDWSYTEYVTTAERKLVLGAGTSNKAMIRPATGAATFYAMLGEAMAAVADGGTVMLANDCDTALPITKVGTYTFDTMGFAHSSDISVADGLVIKSTTVADSSVKAFIPDAIATTYEVVQTVAKVGDQSFYNLTDAVAVALNSGEVVTLLADTDESVVLNKGQSLKLAIASGVTYDAATKITTTVENFVVGVTAASGYTLYKVVYDGDPVQIGTETYGDLGVALSAAKSGDTVTIIADTDLSADGTVPYGATLVIGTGATLTIASGKTLWIDGDATINGAISGTYSKCTKLIYQEGENGEPFCPYADDERHNKDDEFVIKYWKTKISTLSSLSGASSHTTIQNGLGEAVYHGANASAFVCTVNKSVAVNHITGVLSSQTSALNAYNAIENMKPQMVLLTANGSVSVGSSVNIAKSVAVDCASAYSISFSGKQLCDPDRTWAQNPVTLTLINSTSATAPKVTTSRVVFINCSNTTVGQLNANGAAYMTSVHVYDSKMPSISFASGAQTMTSVGAGVCVFSGGAFSVATSANYHYYGGYYSADPSARLYDSNYVKAEKGDPNKGENANYWYIKPVLPTVYVAQVGSEQFETVQEAVNAAGNNGGTVELLLALATDGLAEPITVAAGKTVTIDLKGLAINAPNGAFINNGTLFLQDTTSSSTPGSVTTGTATGKNLIVNNGMMDITYGTYNGNILLNDETLTTHGGTFTGTLTAASGADPKEVANLRGGNFTQNVTPFLRDGYFQQGGWVGIFPAATATTTTLSGAEAAWRLTFISSADKTLYGKGREGQTSLEDLQKYAELASSLNPYLEYTPEGVAIFDRVVSGGTVSFYGSANNISLPAQTLDSDVAANGSYRMLIKLLKQNVPTPYTYKQYINDVSALLIGIKSNNSNNNGTVATIELQFWHPDGSTQGEYTTVGLAPLAQARYMLGGKKAAIDRGASRLAYDSLAAAVAAVQSGERILIGADCSENVTLPGAGTFTVDPYGFAVTGSVSIPSTCFLKSQEEVESSATAQGVTSAQAVTYVVALKVAQVGETFYDNLTDAVANANGAVVTLLAATDETITLTAEGQTFTLNKNGIAFDDAKVVTTIENGSVTVASGESGTVYTAVTSIVDASDGHKYNSVTAAIAGVPGNDISVTITANDTEDVSLPQGKTLTVTTVPGVTADLTVTPGDGAFIVESAVEGGTKYESKKITVTMAEPQATVEVKKIDHGTESAVTDSAEINAAVTQLMGNHDVPRTDNTDKLDVLDVITVTPTKIVEDVTSGTMIIRSVTFDVVPHLNAGQSLAEGQKLKFRLPVDASATQLAAIVYHGDAQFGIFAVQTYNAEKFIEVESDNFSPYGYELLDGETANPIAAIGTTGYATLPDAIAAASNGDTITVFAGTFDIGSDTIVVNKQVTITGASKDTTTLNSTATGKAAFSIQASNVTIENMTINQADTSANNTKHITIGNASTMPSDLTLQNVKFTGGKYSVEAVASNLTIDSCEFINQPSAPIMLYAVQGTTRITDNVLTQGNVTSTGGMIYHLALSGCSYKTTGSMLVSGNKATGGRALYFWDLASSTEDLTLEIINNAVSEYNNKGVVFYHSGTDLADSFDSISITNNAFWSSFNRPAILRDDTARTLAINASANYWGAETPDFDNPMSGGKYLIDPHDDSNNVIVDSYYQAYDEDTDTLSNLYTVPRVAQNMTTGVKYESLAAAVAAATSGDTIEMLADDRLSSELVIERSVTITGAVDSEGKPLYTIYGNPTDNYNVDVFIKNASSAIDVTIQNVNISEFGHQYKTSTGNAALYVSRSTHADTHVLVSNVTVSAYNNYAIIAPQGHLEVVDCAIDGSKDSSYGTFATGGIWSGDMFDDLPSSTVSVVRTSIINTDSNMPGVTGYAIDARAGSTVTVTDCTIMNVHDGIAAAASQESGDGEASVSVSGTTVTASRNALAITGNPQIANTVLAYLEVTSGMFVGAVTIPDEFVDDGIIEISGGVFDRAVPEDYCATGYVPAANTDAATSAVYPYTVGAAVAQIVRGGNVVAKYESLVAAYNASESGDTIELLGDDRSLSADDNAELTITKSLTITGPVDANGDPLYTIYGKNDSNGYNDIFIRAGASDTVTISNVNVAQFGNQASLVMDVAPIYVGGGNAAKVVLDNVHVSEFLRIGVMMSGSGEFEVRNCYIDGTRERSDTCSYGIEVHRGAHGVIADTTIENVSSTSEGWGAACVTINGQGAVSITNCTFVGGVNCDGIGTSENATEGACTSVVTIEDSTIDADCAMGMNVDGAQFVVKSGTYSGYLGLKDGCANAAPYSISGGMFEYEVPEEFCADGYIPAPQDPVTGLYTVKTGTYVARNVNTGVGYETLYSAVAAATAGDMVTLLTNVTESLTISKNLTLTGDWTITGSTRFDAGATVTISNLTFDANGVIYAMNIAGGSTVDLQNATVGGGQWCNIHLNNGTLTGSGVTMKGDQIVVAADGQTYTYRGETYQASDAPWGLDVTKVPGKTLNVPYMDIVREGDTDTITLSDSEQKQLTPAGSILFVSNMPEDETLTGVTLPARFSSYTLTLDADVQFFGGADKPVTGWAVGNWNEIIDTGAVVLQALDENPAEVPVELELNNDVDLGDGDNGFEFRYPNLTIDGNGNAVSGTIKYTDNAGIVSNVVLGTESSPIVLDMTGVTKPIEIGSSVVVSNVTVQMTAEQATAGTPVIIWDAEGGVDAPANEDGVAVALVDGEGNPTGDTADLIWDDEMGMAYIGPCEARLTGPTHGTPIYTTLTNAIAQAAASGDTVTLLMDVSDVTGTITIDKSLTLDGGSNTVSAAAVPADGHRNMFDAFTGGTSMLKIEGDVTLRNITLDGDATHRYTYLVSADNSSAKLTTSNVRLLNGGELAGDANGAIVEQGAGYGAGIHLNNGAQLVVSNGFYACTGGPDGGVFPFTGILPEGGASVSFELTENPNDPANVDIGNDLLLVGMVGVIPLDQVQDVLDYMKVPSRFIPYTLTLGDGSAYAFTGASSRTWNDIIDYGKEIMDVSTAIGYEGLDKVSTPVEVGLLTDTVLPDTFRFADTNFTVNGNGNALAGTIEYTDNAGQIHDIVMGTEGNALVLDMTDTTKPIVIGSGISVSNVTVQMTAEQAKAGTPVIIWDAAHGVDAPENEAGVTVQIVDDHGDSTGVTKELIWDDEMGMAYIGPCEARLTGPTHDKPVYTTLANAIAWAEQTGDTVTLLMNVTNVTTTYEISKQDLVIDGAGYTVAAAPVTQHRNMFEAWSGSKNMFKLQTGNITFRNISLDGDETHAYTFLISADNSSVALTTENVRLIHGGEISEDSNNAAVTPGNGYGAAIHLNNGAHLVVSNGFYACTGTNVNGVTTGVFPFTAILPENLEAGTSVAFELTGNPNDPANVDIGDDLLLVGMIGDLIEQYGIDNVQEILDYMKVPSRFIPYTLTLADGSAYAFTGASPRRWNEIIDYGKDIMDVATANGFSGLDKDTTPVEVGLATDTVLPAGADGDGYDFLYEDSNFSINGNGNALSGTIKFTDDADGGMLSDIVLGTEENPLTLDLSETDNPVDLGDGVVIQDVVVLMTEDQATLGKVVFDWDVNDEEPPDDEQGVTVTVVNSSGEPTGEEKGLVWDEEYGVAYIGPVEARLTGTTHETPVYTSLANALDIAKDNDKVELLTNAVLSAVQGVGSDVTLDLAGYKVSVNGEKGLLVTNATLVIADTSAATNGMICAGDEASPASLIESGNGGVVNIPTGILVAASGQNVLVTSDNGSIAVSGGYFSNPVLPEHCAENYMPVDAEAGAPQPYTVAEFVNEFRYPIDGSVGVPVERTWLAKNFSDIYSDPTKPVLANVTNALVEALSENGANEMPRWESYVLGLDPTVVTARLRLTATSKDAATVTITGLIDMTKFPNPEGTTITFRLAEVNPDGTKKEDLVTDSDEPLFDVLLEEVVGKELAIFADIAVEAVAK